MKLVGANAKPRVAGLDELSGKANYFVGDDPEKWRTNVSTYAKVRYKDVYPGVDLVYHGNQGQLEYDFVVAPGADPHVVTLEMKTRGSELRTLRGQIEMRAWIDDDGNLVLPTEGGELRFHKPVVYQTESDGTTLERASRNYIESHYVLQEPDRVAFEVAAYDRRKALVIDPVLSYSTFLGGSTDDFGNAIAVDSDGNIYVTGGTTSANFFTTPSADQVTYAGDTNLGFQSVIGDVFVTKLTPSGSVVYSTYLGGTGGDNAYGIAVDAAKNVYLTGGTNSLDFPVTPAGVYRPTSGVGLNDVFVAKLDPTGSALVYSTHIGVSGEGIRGFGIDVDAAGSAYVAGGCGPGFPTTAGAFQAGSNAFSSAFVMKLNPTGTAASYSTFLSGGGTDYAESVAVDKNGNAYVTGYASSATFPTTAGGFQTVLGGGPDAFVTVLNPTGSGLVYSTFLGGALNDEGSRIAVDSFSMAYVAGVTSSSNFPTTAGAFHAVFGGGNADAFIAKIDPTKSGAASLIYSTYLGGSGDDNANKFPRGILAVDNVGNAYITGSTTSTDFPTVNPIQGSPTSGFHAFLAKLNTAGSKLIYSTYLGGSNADFGHGIYVDSAGNAFVTGQTYSADFPLTSNAFQPTFGGTSDAFVVEILPVASLSQASLTFANLAVGSTSAAQITTLTNERNTPLNITNIAASGDFAQTNTCGASLGAGLTCDISVTFSPTAPLNRTGSITVTDDASNSPQMLALSGIGVGPAVAVGGGSLGTQLVGTSSTVQALGLTNTGNAPLTIASIGISGANSSDFAQTNTCSGSNATLAANANCGISVTFTPAATGNRAAAITVTDNAPGSPHSFPLTGTGTDFSLSAATGPNCASGGNCSTSATISAGQTAIYNLQVTPNSGFNGAVSLACQGAPGGSACSISPSSLPANGSYAFAVTVSNTSNVLLVPPLQMPRIPAMPTADTTFVLFFLMAGMLILRARFVGKLPRRLFAPAMAVLVLGLVYTSGCGGGGSRMPTNATLTITGVSAGVNRGASLNLTVNH